MGFIWQDLVNGVSPVRVEEINSIAHAIYDLYPTETTSAATGFRTLLGADGIPVKAATVKQTSDDVPTTWVIRRCGKNLFDASTCEFVRAAYLNNSGVVAPVETRQAACKTYIPVLPGSRVVSRGLANTLSDNVYYRIAFYGADKTYVGRNTTVDTRSNFAVTIPSGAFFFRFCCANAFIGTNDKMLPQYAAAVQFEILDDPAAQTGDATPWEAYQGEDTPVTVTAKDTPTAPTTMPTTALGQNVISLFPDGALTDYDPTTAIDLITETATMDIVYRLDPTLVYNALKG